MKKILPIFIFILFTVVFVLSSCGDGEQHVHTEKIISAVEPTCTEIGLTEGKKCSECGEIIVAQMEISALGHEYIANDSQTPTCTEFGWKSYLSCSRCEYSTFEKIEATGHTEKVIDGYAATCTEAGLSDGKICTVCKETIAEQSVIPSKGHTEEIIVGYAATCTEDGLADGKKCFDCNEVLMSQETIPAKGHTAKVMEDGIPSTCTQNGAAEGTVCSECGIIIASSGYLPLTKHTVENDKCIVCGLEANKSLTFTLNSDKLSYTASLNSSVKNETSIIIPSTYNGKPVTATQAHEFPYADNGFKLKSIYLPSSITEIGDNSFEFIETLEVVYIPSSVEKIGSCPFSYGSENLIIYSQGDRAKSGWSNLWNTYRFESGGPVNYKVIWLDLETDEIGLIFMSYGDWYVVSGMSETSTTTNIVIPSTYNGLPVVSIEENAFRDNSKIESVYISGGIKGIGKYAFYNCTNLKSVTIESGVVGIDVAAFGKTAISSIFIPASVLGMEAAVFDECVSGLEINCEAETEPSGWSVPAWYVNGTGFHYNINWGCTRE